MNKLKIKLGELRTKVNIAELKGDALSNEIQNLRTKIVASSNKNIEATGIYYFQNNVKNI